MAFSIRAISEKNVGGGGVRFRKSIKLGGRVAMYFELAGGGSEEFQFVWEGG